MNAEQIDGHVQDSADQRSRRIEALMQTMNNLIGVMDRILDPRLQERIENLPSLNETDLEKLDLLDSDCPICYLPFRAILATEEMALAMDSPATAKEELGITQLKDSCGHVFCRKDIITWIREHISCPMCRQSLFPADHPSQHQHTPRQNDAQQNEPDGTELGETITRNVESLSRLAQRMIQSSIQSSTAARSNNPRTEEAQHNVLADAETIAGSVQDELLRIFASLERSEEGSGENETVGEGAPRQDEVVEDERNSEDDSRSDREEFIGMYS